MQFSFSVACSAFSKLSCDPTDPSACAFWLFFLTLLLLDLLGEERLDQTTWQWHPDLAGSHRRYPSGDVMHMPADRIGSHPLLRNLDSSSFQ